MSKYVKLFKDHSGYTDFVKSEEFLIPNLSHCILEEDVHYNPRIKWYDDEFKRICLQAFNGGKEMTYYDLVSVTQEQWDRTVNRSSSSIFSNNANIHSIKDVEKFVNVDTLGNYTFNGCTGVEGELVIPSNIKYLKNFVFDSMSNVTSIKIDHEVLYDSSESNWGARTFGKLTKVNGIVDFSNFKNISTYHEFDSLGSASTGCKVIFPALNQHFGVWFASAKITAMAGSEEELEDGVAKIPEGYTHGGQLAFNSTPIQKIICPETMETFDNFGGGEESWNYVRYFEMGSKTRLLKGAVCGANSYSGARVTVVCKAKTPPTMEQGGIGLNDNTRWNFPFMSTRIGALYVPDESVDLYKESSTIVEKAPKEYSYAAEMEENVEIGWKRFASVIKPLSELGQ